ncbi:MAG: glycosyltransferase family 39 protein [Candidatus Promineifilaceae bacterium]
MTQAHNSPPFSSRQRLWLGAILLAYALLGLVYMLATPPLESSDEYKHFPVVQFIQMEGQLPILDPDNPGRWLQEGAQPPLYYWLMAGLTSWIDTSDLPDVYELNKHAFVGNPNQIGNKNLMLHQPEREQFPGQGTILAIYLIRLASIGFGLGTVWITAVLGQQLFSSQVGLLAAALTAFNPMFLFISAAVNNDSLSVLLGSLGLLLLVQLWQQQPDPHRAWWRYVSLGLVLGLGILTKLSLGGLLGLTGLSLLWLTWREKRWQLFWVGGPLVLVTAVLVSGWWFWRNWTLYQDLTGLNVFIAVQGTRTNPITWADWVSEFGTFFRSYWGLFGGVNVAAPSVFYWFMNSFFVIGIIGWLHRPKQMVVKSANWLVVAWSLIVFTLLIRWNLISPAFQGRLIFPALAGINVLWAIGLLAWVPAKRQWLMLPSIAGLLAVAALLLASQTIRPAYTFPTPVTEVPAAAQIDPILFTGAEGVIHLVGTAMEPEQTVQPGGTTPVKVTLYWQLTEPVSHNLITGIHLLGRNFESVGQVNRHPASGQQPTSRWQVGQIWQDEYHIYVKQSAAAPTQLRVSVNLFDPEGLVETAASSQNGHPFSLVLVGPPARLIPDAPPPQPDTTLSADFDQGIRLLGYDLTANASPGEEISLMLLWQATAQPDKAYTIFVHLVNDEGYLLTTGDSPPVQGDFPTNLWRTDNWIDDEHKLQLPPNLLPSSYRLQIGLYDPVSGVRLSLVGGGDSITIPLEVQP